MFNGGTIRLLSKYEEFAKNRYFVENYMKSIYDATIKEYPDKAVVGGLFAYFSYDSYPSSNY